MNESTRADGQSRETDCLEWVWPDDFSPDEIALAKDLHTLFRIASDELPPRSAQMLMHSTRGTQRLSALSRIPSVTILTRW